MWEESSEKQQMIPLVEARPVMAGENAIPDGESPSSPVLLDVEEEGHKAASSEVKVSLIAPTALSPGYRLPIKYREGGNTISGFCRVPECGVREGQTFEAAIIQPRAIHSRWAVGTFDCGSLRDTAFCMLSCCCTAVAWGCLYESAFKKPSGSCWVILVVLTVVYHMSSFVGTADNPMLEKGGKSSHGGEGDFLSLLVTILSWTIIIVVTCIRARIRKKFQIPGNYCQDCLCATVCGCCSAVQTFQHLERSQENPRLLPLHEQHATLIV